MTVQEVYKTTRIESHFWKDGKCFELRKIQNGRGDWIYLGLYHMKERCATEINIYFLDSYRCLYNDFIGRYLLDKQIEIDTKKYLRKNSSR